MSEVLTTVLVAALCVLSFIAFVIAIYSYCCSKASENIYSKMCDKIIDKQIKKFVSSEFYKQLSEQIETLEEENNNYKNFCIWICKTNNLDYDVMMKVFGAMDEEDK